jgi:hypothetical protein
MKFGEWVTTKAVPFVEKWWKPIAIVIGVILAIILGKRIIGKVVDAIFGTVHNGMPFAQVPGDPTHVMVQTPAGTQVIKLPVDAKGHQVTADQVTAISYTPGYLAKVEVKNAVTNRG